MAEKLDSFVFTGRGRTAKHPWDEWLDGSIWKLRQGEDFPMTPLAFTKQVYKNAKERGGHARTSSHQDVLVIQFFRNGDES